MADYTPPGGRDFGTPDFSDAVPPNPANQGSKGPTFYTNPTTFESGSVPADTGAIESNWSSLIDDDALSGRSMDMGSVADKGMGEGIRGFRTTPVGGSYNPGRGNPPASRGTERSNAS